MPVEQRLSFSPSGIQWAFDATSLKVADTCLRKYQYEILEGWESPFRSVHLWFGGLYATALEHYHKLLASGEDREAALRSVIVEALVGSWDHDLDEAGNRIPGTGRPHASDHNAKTRENLIRTIIWYVDQFSEDHYSTYIAKDGKPAVEFSFHLPVDEGISFVGHIDRLCLDPAGEVFVHDQKTTGTTISPYFFKGYKPDIQMSMYTFVGRATFQAPVRGVILDAAQIAVGFSRFGRAPILFTDDELTEWYDEMMQLIEAVKVATENQVFPKRPASCGNFGGCAFREVCSRPKQVREAYLQADFVKRQVPWDPARPR